MPTDYYLIRRPSRCRGCRPDRLVRHDYELLFTLESDIRRCLAALEAGAPLRAAVVLGQMRDRAGGGLRWLDRRYDSSAGAACGRSRDAVASPASPEG